MNTIKTLLLINFYINLPIYQLQSQTIMNLQAQGLRTVIYKVDDLNAAKIWYAKVFDLQPYFDQPFYVGFNIGGYELGLLEEATTTPKTTNILTYWAIDDITDSYDIMCTLGAKELEAPNEVGDGIKVALVKDPWENVIGLIYNPHFKTELPKNTIVEWAPFTLKKETQTPEFLEISSRMEKEFLVKQPGFIKRELLHESGKNWVDKIYWKNEESAHLALESCHNSEVFSHYVSLMMEVDPNRIKHFEVVSK